jgi:magnesium-transporting ATPase (P-type)
MCKGADSVIKELLSRDSVEGEVYKSNQQAVDKAAVKGLRTLFLAERCLTED